MLLSGLDWTCGGGRVGGAGGAGGVGRDGGRLVELRWPPPEQGVLRSRGPAAQGGWGTGPWAQPGRGLGPLAGKEGRQTGPHVRIWRRCSDKRASQHRSGSLGLEPSPIQIHSQTPKHHHMHQVTMTHTGTQPEPPTHSWKHTRASAHRDA